MINSLAFIASLAGQLSTFCEVHGSILRFGVVEAFRISPATYRLHLFRLAIRWRLSASGGASGGLSQQFIPPANSTVFPTRENSLSE